jgi:Ca-activated chloride channel family protein
MHNPGAGERAADANRINRHLSATFAQRFSRGATRRAPRPRAQWHCPTSGGPGEEEMRNEAGIGTRAALTDLVELLAKALLSGIGAAVAMAIAVLALSSAAQAASPNDAKAGTLLLGAGADFVTAPTVETQVGIEVTGMIARTRVSQVFHNPGAEFVEGVYVFPLPPQAAVDHLTMRIGNRTLEGEIREKEDARRRYEQARREGRKAALVQQLRPNLFTNAVAHIGPGEYVRVSIEFQQPLAYDDGVYRLRIPLTATPRYMPAALREEPAPAETSDAGGDEADNPYPGEGCGDALNKVDIVALIDAGMPLASVRSSYQDITIEKSASGGRERTVVMLSRDQELADRDFELAWAPAAGAAPQAAIFTQRGTGGLDHALLMVIPPQPLAAEAATLQRLPRETILVVDTSGSMQGASMQQATQALLQALATLTPRDRFNVLEFNSVMRPMWPEALPATGTNVQSAREWVKGLKAGGGTEMAPALTFALAGTPPSGYLRQVVFMTDGGVSNEEDLFRLIERQLGDARLFTVGIGAAPNAHFMETAARFGRGTFTQIGDVREVREKMTRLFAKIEAPVLRDVRVAFADGRPAETFPARIPDLYLGEPVIVAAAQAGPMGTVVVSGMRGNQPWSVALTPSADGDAAGVGALWARAKIASLMDEVTRGADPAQVRPQVVKVALEHHLVSAYTSLVATDVQPTGPAGGVKTVVVRAMAPSAAVDLPQTDTDATLRLLAGLLTLGLAAMAARVARPAARR